MGSLPLVLIFCFAAATVRAADSSGEIQCPENFGQPDASYASSRVYNWTIRGPQAVMIKFHFVEVEATFDRLELFEMTESVNESFSRAAKFRIESHNASSIAFGLWAPVLIKFTTDGSVTFKGFNLTYTFVDNLIQMRSFSAPSDMAICSSDETNNSRSEFEVDYQWSIDRPGKIYVKLHYTEQIRVYQMTTKVDREPVFTDEPKQGESMSEFGLFGPVLLRVTSRPMKKLFSIEYRMDDGEYSIPTEFVRSATGERVCNQSSSAANSSRAWSFQVNPQQTMELQLFDGEGSQPHGDTVSVYTGVEPGLSELPIFSQTGQLGKRRTVRATGLVTVLLRSGSISASRGLRFTYTLSNVSRSEPSGEIEFSAAAPGGGIDYRWYISRHNRLSIRFLSLSLRSDDKLLVYENTTLETEAAVRFLVTDTSAIGSEFRLSGPAIIRLTGRGESRLQCGFRLTYTADQSPDSSVAVEVIKSYRGLRWLNAGNFTESDGAAAAWIISASPGRSVRLYLPELYSTAGVSVAVFKGAATSLSDSRSLQQVQYASIVKNDGPLTVVYRKNSPQILRELFNFTFQVGNALTSINGDSGTISCPEEAGQTYESDMEYRWTIKRLNFVVVRFTSVDIGHGNDIVQLYEETWEADEPQPNKLRFTLTQQNATQKAFKLKGPVLVRFVTDKALVGSGFSLSYTTEERVLHRVLGHDSGNIFFPEESNVNYEKSMDFRWTLNRTNALLLRFDFVDIRDTIEIFENIDDSGEVISEKLKLTLTQESAQSSNYSLIGPVMIRLRTNSIVAGRGFRMFYQTGAKVLSSGNFSYPERFGYDMYENNIDYVWSIPEAKTMVITVHQYKTEAGNDKIYLYERMGPFEKPSDYNYTTTISGSGTQKQYRLEGPVLIRFKTDSSYQSEGFIMSFEIEEQTRISDDSGSVTFEDTTAAQRRIPVDYVWIIDRKAAIAITISGAELPGCCDQIQLFEKWTPDQQASLRDAEVTLTKENATSTAYRLIGPVVIKLRNRKPAPIALNFSYAVESQIVKSKTLESPGLTEWDIENKTFYKIRYCDTDGYEMEVDYSWVIDTTDAVSIRFPIAQWQQDCDTVELHEMTKDPTERSRAFVLTNVPLSSVMSSEFKIRGPAVIRATSPRMTPMMVPFRASFRTLKSAIAMSTEFLQCISGERGCVEAGGVSNCQANLVRAWAIAVNPQQIVELQLFDAEGGQSSKDSVSVYLGLQPEPRGVPYFHREGRLDKRQTLTIHGFVTIVLRTDASSSRRGFGFTYSIGNVTLRESSGVIRFPPAQSNLSYSADFSQDMDYRWIVDSSSVVRITVDSVDLQKGDKVYLYQNTISERADNLRFAVTDGSALNSEFILSGPVLVRFTASGDGNRRGFQLTYRKDAELNNTGESFEIVRSSRGSRASFPDSDIIVGDGKIRTVWVISPRPDHEFTIHLLLIPDTAYFGKNNLRVFDGNWLAHVSQRGPSAYESDILKRLYSLHTIYNQTVSVVFEQPLYPMPFSRPAYPIKFEYQIRNEHRSLTEDSGSIRCPEEPGTAYANEMEYRWTINRINYVIIRIASSDIGHGNDVIQLYEMTDGGTDEPEESKLKYSLTQENATSASYRLIGPALVRFTTDQSRVGQGFSLNYIIEERIVSQELTMEKGSVKCDVDRDNYENLLDYRWTVNTSNVVFITFTSMDIPDSNDVIELYERMNASGDLDLTRRKFVLAASNTSSEQYGLVGPVVIRFRTNKQISGRGFTFNYVIDRAIADGGQVLCPENYGLVNYENSKTYLWWIGGRKIINIRVEAINIEWKSDLLYFFERTDLFASENMAKTFPLLNIREKDSYQLLGPVLIKFQTDRSVTRQGFNFSYTVHDRRERIRNLTDEHASIVCSEGDQIPLDEEQKYEIETDYKWLIDRQDMLRIRMTHADTVRLYELASVPNEEKLVFYSEHESRTNATTVEFRVRGPVLVRVTTKRIAGNIFKLAYNRLNFTSETTMSTEIIKSIEGQRRAAPDSVLSSAQRAWSLAVNPQQTVELQLFDVEGSQSHGDTVSVYMGVEPGLSESPIFSHTGQLGERRTVRATGFVTVVLRPGAGEARSRFGFAYSVGNVSVTEPSGVISFQTDLAQSMGHRWVIDRPARVRIRFSSLDLRAEDRLYIYERTKTEVDDSVRFVLDSSVNSEFRLAGPVLIRFDATGAGERSFQLIYSHDESSDDAAIEVIRSNRGERTGIADGRSTILSQPSTTKWIVAPTGTHAFLTHLIFSSSTGLSSSVRIFAGDLEALSSPTMQRDARLIRFSTHVMSSGSLAVLHETSSSVGKSRQWGFSFDTRNVHRSLTEDSGSIRCPEEPGTAYTNEMEYRWTINRRNYVIITITSVDIGHGNDVIQLYEMTDGETDEPEESKLKYSLTQENATSTSYRLIGPVLIRFTTDQKFVGLGFNLSYLIEERSVIKIHSYSDLIVSYPEKANTTLEKLMDYRSVLSQNRIYLIRFISSSLGSDGSEIQVYEQSDKAGEADKRNLKFSLSRSSDFPSNYTLKGPVLIRLRTGRLFDGLGFAFIYTAGPKLVDSGLIKCPESFGSSANEGYSNYMDYQWLINEKGSVTLTMGVVDIEQCCDKIFLYERYEISEGIVESKLKASPFNSSATAASISLEGPVLVRFKTDSSFVKTGFNMTYVVQGRDDNLRTTGSI